MCGLSCARPEQGRDSSDADADGTRRSIALAGNVARVVRAKDDTQAVDKLVLGGAAVAPPSTRRLEKDRARAYVCVCVLRRADGVLWWARGAIVGSMGSQLRFGSAATTVPMPGAARSK